jgi:glyoxylase I family protein
MPEVIGIDHIYIAVSDLNEAERFYDRVMKVLAFLKAPFQLDGEPHIQYYNRYFGYVLRPAASTTPNSPHAPGLHHLCFRVEGETEVRKAAEQLTALGISHSEPRLYPEYAPDYFAIFFTDPDGIVLEITNYRQERRQRYANWPSIEP